MKKFIYLSAAAAATLLATSCSSEDVPVPADGDMTTFQVRLPEELTTRFGEGTTAQKLCVAIYKHGVTNEDPLFTSFGNTTTSGLTINRTSDATAAGAWTVSVPLVKNMRYDIVFWAQSEGEGTPFSYDAQAKTITVDYDGMTNFQEARDAFFGQMLDFQSQGVTNPTVTLNRPFSQINIGTSDYSEYVAASGVASPTFGMSVSGVNNVLSLTDGAVSLDESKLPEGATQLTATTTTTSANGTPLNINETDYSYLGMAYVLTGAKDSQLTVDVNLYVNTLESSFATYPNVPVQMNYRTNIFGQLLTNTENFNVEIAPGFVGESNHEIIVAKPGQTLQEIVRNYNGKDAFIVLEPNTEYTTQGTTFKKGTNYTLSSDGTSTLNIVGIPGNGVNSVILNNLKVKSTYANFQGSFQGNELTYNNCEIEGTAFLYSKKVSYNNCNFKTTENGYAVWTYGCGNVKFDNCTFTCEKVAKAILVYGDTQNLVFNVDVNNCKFFCTEGCEATDKAAIEIHTEKFAVYPGALVTINNAGEIPSQFEGGLWREWYNVNDEHATDFCRIIVDGKVVQQGAGN